MAAAKSQELTQRVALLWKAPEERNRVHAKAVDFGIKACYEAR